MGVAYYNEIDPYAAQWLRNLISAGHIAPGEVDTRSVEDIRPSDITGFTQHHFFAGLGGWSYALRLAGWPDKTPVWTGSCPCQPFSQAGKGQGFDDERHLWPAWYWLIQQRRPRVIFGEQVASADGYTWLDLVFNNLGRTQYAGWAQDISAAGIGAPHVRQRLFWMAYTYREFGRQGRQEHRGGAAGSNAQSWPGPSGSERISDVGNTHSAGLQRFDQRRDGPDRIATWPAGLAVEWIACRDSKARPVESGTFPLANGVPARVGRLRAYGNAIVPQVGAWFIQNVRVAAAQAGVQLG